MLGEQDARSRSLGVRPPFTRGSGGGSRKGLRGVAVAPYVGATRSLPQRDSTVLHSPSLEKTSPTRRRANSVSQAVRALDVLGPLDSLAVLRHQGDALNDRTDSRNSPRRGSYVLQHNRQASRRNRLVKSASLKNFRELSPLTPSSQAPLKDLLKRPSRLKIFQLLNHQEMLLRSRRTKRLLTPCRSWLSSDSPVTSPDPLHSLGILLRHSTILGSGCK